MPRHSHSHPTYRQTSIFFGLALSAAAIAAAPRQGGALPADAIARIDKAITDRQATLKLPAVSVAIALGGSVVYAKAFGAADLENRIAATPETRFRTASVAKPLTATAVMQLADKGALDLDAPIQNACAAFPQKPWPVTARQLLGHLGGVRHYAKPGESTGTQHFFAIADSLALFKNDALLHQPGSKYEYSTYGYSLLGCAIEGASKSPYHEYVTEHILRPLAMSRTTLDDVYQIVPDRARGYQLLTEEGYKTLPPAVQRIAKPNTVYNAVLHDTSMKTAAGGWLSTPSDLVRFGAAMIEGRPVTAATRDAMWTSQKTTDGKETGYGLGFGVDVRDGVVAISHSGNQAGAASLLRISPSRRAVLAIMTNLEDAPLGDMANAIVAAVSAPRSQQ